jgi:hypothetical protein
MEAQSLSFIMENGGSLSEADVQNLSRFMPNLMVGIKFGCSLRQHLPVKDAGNAIAQALRDNPHNYVREVFICCGPTGNGQWELLESLAKIT